MTQLEVTALSKEDLERSYRFTVKRLAEQKKTIQKKDDIIEFLEYRLSELMKYGQLLDKKLKEPHE